VAFDEYIGGSEKSIAPSTADKDRASWARKAAADDGGLEGDEDDDMDDDADETAEEDEELVDNEDGDGTRSVETLGIEPRLLPSDSLDRGAIARDRLVPVLLPN
jgi:hypothetical protein